MLSHCSTHTPHGTTNNFFLMTSSTRIMSWAKLERKVADWQFLEYKFAKQNKKKTISTFKWKGRYCALVLSLHTHKLRVVRRIQTAITECCRLESANSDDSRIESCQPPSWRRWWWCVAAEWRAPPPPQYCTDGSKSIFLVDDSGFINVSLCKGQF